MKILSNTRENIASRKYYQLHKEQRRRKGLEYSKKYKKLYPDRYSASIQKYWRKPTTRFTSYSRDARNRGISFEITYEEMMTFWKKPCFYCGDIINEIGLDRIDSDKGYKIDNLVSCCKYCNMMKKNTPQKEFLTRCLIISRNHYAERGL